MAKHARAGAICMTDGEEYRQFDENNPSLTQALSSMGGRLDSYIQLLSVISSLTTIPVKSKTLDDAADELLSTLILGLNDVDASSILLYDPKANVLKLLAAKGQADLLGESEGPYNRELVFRPGEGIAGRVYSENTPMYWDGEDREVDDLKLEPRLSTPASLACLPLATLDRQIGVLNISFARPDPPDIQLKRDLILLSFVAANIVQTFLLKAEVDEKAAFLQEARDELEARVLERTIELEKANIHLRQEVQERRWTAGRLQAQTTDLQERIKELHCLYGISSLFQKTGIVMEDILQGVVDRLPSGMQYPGITCARIILDEREYVSSGFRETQWKLSSPIRVYNELRGTLAIYHLEKSPSSTTGPFLVEEKGLLDSIAERLGQVCEQRKAEEAVKESEARYRSLVENTSDGCFVLEWPAGRFLFLNQNMCDLFGYSHREALKKNIHDLFELDTETCTDIFEGRDWPDGARKPLLLIAKRENGSIFTAEAGVSRVTFEGREVIQGVVRDVTEQERLKQQLIQAQKMEAIGTLAGGIAHDFNNILAAIIGYTQLVQKKMPAGTQEAANLEQVVQAGRRARDLVKQILTFSRQTETRKQALLVSPIVKEVMKLLRASLPTTIAISQNIRADSVSVWADPTQLHQILMNLGTNSGQAMIRSGGLLEVSLDQVDYTGRDSDKPNELPAGSYMLLEVRDTGPGIDPEIINRIFEPYFTTKKMDQGTGLGLSVVHGIVKNHGGAVIVSSNPGRGAVFRVFLPSLNTIQETTAMKPETIEGGRERILIVDDEVTVTDYLCQTLEHLGYQVSSHTNSLEALTDFRSRPDQYDLIITDLTMPHLTGLDLSRAIQAIRSDIPIILCTGFSDPTEMEKVRDMGIQAMIMKPVLAGELAAQIRSVLE